MTEREAHIAYVDKIWEEHISKIIEKNADNWRAEFMEANKTWKERTHALTVLDTKATAEWRRLLRNLSNINWREVDSSYNADDGRRMWREYKEQLKGMTNPNSQAYYKLTYLSNGSLGYKRVSRGEYKDSLYLKGEDFKRTRYASMSSAEIMSDIKNNYLLNFFKKGGTISDIKNDFKQGMKYLGGSEIEKWKTKFRSSAQEIKHRALSAADSLLKQLDPGIGDYYKKVRDTIGNEIPKAFENIRNTYVDAATGAVKDTIDYFQEMGSKYINGVKAKAIDYAVNTGRQVYNYLAGKFGGVASKFGSIIPEPVARLLAPAANILGASYNKIVGSLGLGPILGKGTSSYSGSMYPPEAKDVALWGNSPFRPRSLASISQDVDRSDVVTNPLTEEIQYDWDRTDIFTASRQLSSSIRLIIEDAGYVASTLRSINYSRNYHFVIRPVLASDEGGYYRSYAFLTRPNLNIFSKGEISKNLDRYPELKAIVLTDPGLYSELCRDGAYKSNLFKLVNNYIKEIPPIKLTESSREGVANMHGKAAVLPGALEIFDNIDIPITFIDNNRGDIAKLFYFMSMYKEAVAKQGYPMRPDYIKYRAFDYLMSLHIVTVDPNWNVIGYGISYNLTIPDPPTSFTQHKMDGFSKEELLENFTLNFKATSFVPFAPDMYDTFNVLSGFNPAARVDTYGYEGRTLLLPERGGANATSETEVARTSLLNWTNYESGSTATNGQNLNAEISPPLYPGKLEMLAISPGFYRESRYKDAKDGVLLKDTRLNIKFGFSS